MLRALLLTIFVLIMACSTDDTPSGSAAHHYFDAGKTPTHTRRGVLGILPHASEGGAVGGGVHAVAADYRPSDNRRPVIDVGNRLTPLLLEAQLSPDDSLTLLVSFSYTVQDDSVCEVVSGTLHVPIAGESVLLHHKLRGLPFYGIILGGAEPRHIIPGLDFLPM